MKQKFIRLIIFTLTFVILLGTVSASAQSSKRASDYFSYTRVVATPLGDGEFAVEFDINATHIMDRLGATEIVYLGTAKVNGSYEDVKTYTSGLIDTNTSAAYRRVNYQGTPGVQVTMQRLRSMQKTVPAAKPFTATHPSSPPKPKTNRGKQCFPRFFFTPSDIRRPTAPCGTSWDPCCPPWRTAAPG